MYGSDRAGEPKVLENSEGGRTTPSVVAINPKSEERYVGLTARRQAVTNPENTVFSVKRFMGMNLNDKAIKNDIDLVPYKVEAGSNGGVAVNMAGKSYAPPEIAAMTLQKMKTDAEAKIGEKITSIPESFNVHPTLKKIFENKKKMFQTGKGFDWATAEHLAFATLLEEGYPVRLSGQDSARGTFSQRHSVLKDQLKEIKS